MSYFSRRPEAPLHQDPLHQEEKIGPVRSGVEALRYLLQEDDLRLQVPAVKVAVCFEETVLTKHVQDLTEHPNLNVRRAAHHELGWPPPPEQSVSAPKQRK
jgi:hypothetical protein